MKLNEGQELAEEILNIISPLCERVEVAGSIRRRKAEVKDVDIVLIPKMLFDIVGILQRKMEAKVVKRGARVVSLTINGVGVDLNFCNEEEFVPLLLFRTGSWRHNMKLASKAKRLGLKFSPYGLLKDGARIDENTEESIFEVLGEGYRKPEER